MTNKLQLVLIDNLIKSIITLAKVLQGSVSTHLRCDGTFNDQFITQSLLSFMVKKRQLVNIFYETRKYWNISTKCSKLIDCHAHALEWTGSIMIRKQVF